MNFKLLLLGIIVLSSAISFVHNGNDLLKFDLKKIIKSKKSFHFKKKPHIQSTVSRLMLLH